ncbi:hypothetical protein ACIBG8_38130 [Nonomuraea sp. NPDC050556]|uniref:hypothetical protein n=1 Tax=Nonomuraea sp. NPDC050556 TaxID=3364369 RepID=UPI0037B3AB6E
MGAGSVRRILAVKLNGPWLVLLNEAWNVESRNGDIDTPFARSRLALLPLLERPRQEVESQASQALGPSDPSVAEALLAIVECGLMGPSEYWLSRALSWMTPDEVGLLAGQLNEIATGHQGSQTTQHTAKRLLKQNGLWQSARRAFDS